MSFLNQEAQENPFSPKPSSGYFNENETVINKVAKFIESKQVSISDFWQSDRNCASAVDIVSFCKHVGLNLPEYDVINIKSEIFSCNEAISVDQFALYIPFWEGQEKDSVSEFLKKRSDMLLDKLQAKERKRPKTGMPSEKEKLSRTSEHFRSLTRHSSANRFKRES